ncbi:MAG: hypothetical protein ACHRXM_33000 [Isosphaerales bacterium]
MIDPIIVSLEAATNAAASPRAAQESITWYCRIARTAAVMPKIATSASFNRRAERGRGKESKLKTNAKARIAMTCSCHGTSPPIRASRTWTKARQAAKKRMAARRRTLSRAFVSSERSTSVPAAIVTAGDPGAGTLIGIGVLPLSAARAVFSSGR